MPTDTWVAFFQECQQYRGGQGSTNTSATVTLEELNITATGEVTATDVWTGADAGAVSNGHWSTGVVGTLDSAFVVIQASAAAGAN